jgi:hypothetical protein
LDYGNLNKDVDFLDLIVVDSTNKNKKALLKLIHSLDLAFYLIDCYDNSTLLSFIFEQYFDSNFKDLVELEALLLQFDVLFDKNFELVNIQGHNQGDYATVLINTKEYEAVAGSVFNSSLYKKVFNQFFYESPLLARCIINDIDYISEKFDGNYSEFEPDLFIEDILNQCKETNLDLQILEQELKNIVPDYPLSLD